MKHLLTKLAVAAPRVLGHLGSRASSTQTGPYYQAGERLSTLYPFNQRTFDSYYPLLRGMKIDESELLPGRVLLMSSPRAIAMPPSEQHNPYEMVHMDDFKGEGAAQMAMWENLALQATYRHIGVANIEKLMPREQCPDGSYTRDTSRIVTKVKQSKEDPKKWERLETVICLSPMTKAIRHPERDNIFGFYKELFSFLGLGMLKNHSYADVPHSLDDPLNRIRFETIRPEDGRFEFGDVRLSPFEPNPCFYAGLGSKVGPNGESLEPRSTIEGHKELQRRMGIPVISLQMADGVMQYHTDTLFGVLPGGFAYVYPGALTLESYAILKARFGDKLIEMSEQDAKLFAGNAINVMGHYVVLPTEVSEAFCNTLREIGFDVIQVPAQTNIFLGGASNCMTNKQATFVNPDGPLIIPGVQERQEKGVLGGLWVVTINPKKNLICLTQGGEVLKQLTIPQKREYSDPQVMLEFARATEVMTQHVKERCDRAAAVG